MSRGSGFENLHSQLANLIQTYLNALADSGALERAQRFWFKDPSWVKDLR